MMVTIVVPAAYLPSVTYCIYILQSHSAIIDIHEHYSKQTCRNRCYIYSANGLLPMVIPVFKPGGNHTPVKDIKICYLQRWQSNHWRAIESAYQSSPYFLFCKDDLKLFYQRRYTYLLDFNMDLLAYISKAIKADLPLVLSKEYIARGTLSTDLRDELSFSCPSAALLPSYHQVFQHKFGFISNLSILDLLFNLGPESKEYLDKQILPDPV